MNDIKIAHLISKRNERQTVYRMNPPYEGNEYVVVSYSNSFVLPETYIFPSDREGTISSFLELDGSFRGEFDAELALKRAGYLAVKD